MVLIRLPRWVLIVLFVFSLIFAIGGIFMVVGRAEGGWPALLFFGLCAAVFAAQLWPALLLSRKPESVVAVLARFPGPVELHVPQRKTALILVGVIIFAGVTLWSLHTEPRSAFLTGLLWLCVAAMALALPFILYQFIRGAGLKLEAHGFRVRQPWRTRYIRWTDASEFGVGNASLIESRPGDWSTLVTYDDALNNDSTIGSLNRGIVGRNSALPDTYGFPPEQLQALMNGWRQRALRGGA